MCYSLAPDILVPVLMYGVKQCYGKRRRDLDLGCTDGQPQRIASFPNARIWELCGVKKDLDERIDECVLRWFAHVERIEGCDYQESLCRRVC